MRTKKPKVGDRVWVKIPHNGTIDHIFKNGSVRVVLDEIEKDTTMERFDFGEEMTLVRTYKPNKSN